MLEPLPNTKADATEFKFSLPVLKASAPEWIPSSRYPPRVQTPPVRMVRQISQDPAPEMHTPIIIPEHKIGCIYPHESRAPSAGTFIKIPYFYQYLIRSRMFISLLFRRSN